MAAAGIRKALRICSRSTNSRPVPAQVKLPYWHHHQLPLCDIAPGDDAITFRLDSISYRNRIPPTQTTDSKPFTIHLQNCASFRSECPDTAGSAGKCPKRPSLLAEPQMRKGLHHQRGSAQHVGVQLLKSDNNTAIIEPNTQMPVRRRQLQAGTTNQLLCPLIALDEARHAR